VKSPRPPLDPAAREAALLAPYAMPAARSRGRAHAEPESPHRSVFQRDRDRIVHSTAFRRLEYKTQVFVNHEGDHYRTRLTHSLEVAQISRSVARLLGLNEDLVEAIALSHDLGHPPYGHAGEAELDRRMAGHGGFDHNRHCLRIVDELESRYPGFPGLNLTWEVREAVVRHYGRFDGDLRAFAEVGAPLLEAQLVDIGDSLAYDNHDLDDGFRSGYLTLDELLEVEIFASAAASVRERHGELPERLLVARAVAALIDLQIVDLVAETSRRLAEARIGSVEDVRAARAPLVGFGEAVLARKRALQTFLRERLYEHYRCRRMAEKGKRFLGALFEEYLREPGQLPPEHLRRVGEVGAHRAVCDYLAGMTDRYCLQEYQRLFVPFGDGAGPR